MASILRGSEFIRRSETTEQCFESSGLYPLYITCLFSIGFEADMVAGGWIAHHETPVPSVSLDALDKRLSGEEKESFLAFVRSMLKWMPEERKTAKQLLEQPFLL